MLDTSRAYARTPCSLPRTSWLGRQWYTGATGCLPAAGVDVQAGDGAGVHVPVKKPADGKGTRPGHENPQRAAALPALPARTRLRPNVPAVAHPAAGDAQPGTIGEIAKAALVLVLFEHAGREVRPRSCLCCTHGRRWRSRPRGRRRSPRNGSPSACRAGAGRSRSRRRHRPALARSPLRVP